MTVGAQEPPAPHLIDAAALVGDNLDKSPNSGWIFPPSATADNKPAPLLSQNCLFISQAPALGLLSFSSS